MKIIIIKPKNDFNIKQIEMLSAYNTIFINDIELFKKYSFKDSEEKILAIDPDYTNWGFPNELLDTIQNLKAICLSTTAFDYIDLEYCKKNNIIVTNIPKYAGDSVAEYMFFQAIALTKKYPLQLKNNNKQDFSNNFMQILLKNKKVGIIGLGNNGSRLAKLCDSFGMDVYYYNRTKKDNNYKNTTLDYIFKNCDIIFETLAINDETNKLITDKMINSMSKDTIFVSGSGKNLFNSQLVLEKVKNNEIYGCAWEEPNKGINDFEGNVMITSEYAWFTYEATETRIDIWIECISSILGNKPINLIN